MKKLTILFFLSILFSLTMGICGLNAQTLTTPQTVTTNGVTKTTVKCKALTVKKEPCKNPGLENGYCAIHNPDAPRCGQPTSKGTPCKMKVSEKGQHCYRHK